MTGAQDAVGGTQRVAAVVVTFHPDSATFGELLRAVAPQTEGVVVVDNGDTPLVADLVSQLALGEQVALIRNRENLGLAAAQNQGIEWATTRGFAYVFLLDQDSVPRADCVARLWAAERELRARGVRVAAVGPRVVDRRSGVKFSFKRFGLAGIKHTGCAAGTDLVPADFVISSGSLIPMDALREIGAMDSRLFIDRIDLEWCFRAAAAGRAAYGVCAAELQHEPGDRFVPLGVGHWRQMPVHSATRTYYMVRNSVLLYQRPYAPLRWILNDAIRLLGIVLVSLIIAPERLRRLRLALNGLIDGLRQVHGALADRADRARA